MKEKEALKLYNNFLRGCYPRIRFGNKTYDPSWVFKKIDPIAYKTRFIEFKNGLEIKLIIHNKFSKKGTKIKKIKKMEEK